jgi:hypothetical protein
LNIDELPLETEGEDQMTEDVDDLPPPTTENNLLARFNMVQESEKHINMKNVIIDKFTDGQFDLKEGTFNIGSDILVREEDNSSEHCNEIISVLNT